MKMNKRLLTLVSSSALLAISSMAFANVSAAPKCPSLSTFSGSQAILSYYYGTGHWEMSYQDSPQIINGGLVDVNLPVKEESKALSIYKDAEKSVTSSANATKVPEGDGSYFWACSDLYKSYNNIPNDVSHIFFCSDDYNSQGLKSGVQPSLKQKEQMAKSYL